MRYLYRALQVLRSMRRPYCLVFGHRWVEDDDCTIHCGRCDIWDGDTRSENRDQIFRDEVVMWMVRMTLDGDIDKEDELYALNCAVRGALDIGKLIRLMDEDPMLPLGAAEYYPSSEYDMNASWED